MIDIEKFTPYALIVAALVGAFIGAYWATRQSLKAKIDMEKFLNEELPKIKSRSQDTAKRR